VAAIGIDALWRSLRRDWLIQESCSERYEHSVVNTASANGDWFDWVEQRRTELSHHPAAKELNDTAPPVVLIAEADPAQFLAGFWAGLLSGWTVVLANAQWGAQEWNAVSEIVAVDVVWPSSQHFRFADGVFTTAKKPTVPESILIPTGGSSGQVKFAHHTWTTLTTSARGFLDYFSAGSEPVHAFCVLPVYHVSGLMQAIRGWLSGGQLVLTHFKSLLSQLSESPSLVADGSISANTFISLVPTQLVRLLDAGLAPWLTQFSGVLLGGAPAWPQLLARSRSHNIPLCLSYGMTETAAMVTALHPQDFLNGNCSSGQVLPHAAVDIQQARIVVRSDAIAQGYFNAATVTNQTLHTDDLGYLTAEGYLHIIGRASNKIISGGENIYPAEVEAALRTTGQVQDVCVVGLPDAQWGEVVTAVYVPATDNVSAQSLKAALTAQLISRYKCPKRWHAVNHLPRNAQGKVNRSALMTQLMAQLSRASE